LSQFKTNITETNPIKCKLENGILVITIPLQIKEKKTEEKRKIQIE
jgi:HSP20 family molecular chaperone IbpA